MTKQIATTDEALVRLAEICDYAYESGYHELGWSPVGVVSQEMERLRAEVTELGAQMIVLKARPLPTHEPSCEHGGFVVAIAGTQCIRCDKTWISSRRDIPAERTDEPRESHASYCNLVRGLSNDCTCGPEVRTGG